MKLAPPTRKLSTSSGKPSSSSSPPTCTTGIERSALSAHSKATSCQSWQAWTPWFPRISGTCCSHKLNLPSISSDRPRSAHKSALGSISRVPLTLTRCLWGRLVVGITRQLWDFCAKQGLYIGSAMDSYRCFKLVSSDTKSQCISYTVEFRHKYLLVPAPSTDDRIIHGLQQVAEALVRAPLPTSISQVDNIANLWDIFKSWCLLAPPNLRPYNRLTPGFTRGHSYNSLRRTMLPPPTPFPTFTPTPTRIPPPPPSSLRRVHHLVPPAGQTTPPWLDFSNTPAPPTPRVPCVSTPANVCPPPAPPAILPVR